MNAAADAFFGIFGMKRVEHMTFDHRTLPGIEFVPCPGPLRVGDYWRDPANGDVLPIWMDQEWSINRVIPVVRPLATPEISTETRADMEACAEVVVAVAFCGNSRLCPADDHGPKGCDEDGYMAKRWALLMGEGAYDIRRIHGDGRSVSAADETTEAAAVLWTVEGKLPGGDS